MKKQVVFRTEYNEIYIQKGGSEADYWYASLTDIVTRRA
jgi:hypothetical protein